MALLIDHLRDVTGLPLRGLHKGYHVGWTRDEDKAEAARAAGAYVTHVRAVTDDADGWEVSLRVGSERRALDI